MKLWDSLTTCLILLSAVRGGPLQHRSARRRGRTGDGTPELPSVQIRLSVTSPGFSSVEPAGGQETLAAGGQYTMEELLPSEFEDVVDFIKVTISRIRRSSSSTSSFSSSSSSTSLEKLSSRTRSRRERKKGANKQSKGGRGRPRGGETGRKMKGGGRGRGGGRGGGGRVHGCTLRQLQLNVSDLGLGYRSGEEMIFRYCSGPCRKSETNYDKILFSLVHNRKLTLEDTPPQACCRPIAFDDDLSFLDDSLIYHTVRRHSARKCGCV